MSYQPSEDEIKHRRNVYLERSDIYVLPDRWETYTAEQKSEWSTFRQALRDIPSQAGYPTVIDWPQSPVNLNVEVPEGWPPEWV